MTDTDPTYYVLEHSDLHLPVGPFASMDEAVDWKMEHLPGDYYRRASWSVKPMQSPLEPVTCRKQVSSDRHPGSDLRRGDVAD